MQDDIRASLDDLAIRWETPRGRELKKLVIADARTNGGEGIKDILRDFMYVKEIPHGKDLRCITLDGEDLTDGRFGKVDMSWASMANATMVRVNLVDANLKRANFQHANLSLARLDGIDGSRADFRGATLDGTHLKEAKLTGAVLIEADISRASFDSANLAKCNFQGVKLDQANFFNADCNNSNFDSGALDRVAERPAKAWGLRWDMPQDEFEKQVGLKAITSRSTKRFKGLEALLKASKLAESLGAQPTAGPNPEATPAAAAPTPDEPAPGGGMFFGTGMPGSKRHSREELEQDGLEQPTVAEPAPSPPAAGERPNRPTRAQRPTRRPPPPRGPRPGGPPPAGTGPQRRPPAPGATGRPPGPPRGPRPGGPPPAGTRPGGPPPGTRSHRPPRPTERRPQGAPAPAPAPKLPIAPFDPEAPQAATDWAKAIGQLMQLKGSVSKIVVELGDKSRIIFKKTP